MTVILGVNAKMYLSHIRKNTSEYLSHPTIYPMPYSRYRIGVYIRYFNQTKHENYLDYHKQQFIDTISLCPNWQLVDFYIDTGISAPSMESSPEWCRLLEDCFSGNFRFSVPSILQETIH